MLNLWFIGVLLFSTIFCFVSLGLAQKLFQENEKKQNILALIATLGTTSVVSFLLLCFPSAQKEFVYDLDIVSFLTALVGSFAIFFVISTKCLKKYAPILIVFLATFIAYLMPEIYLMTLLPINIWITRLLFVLLICLFSFGYKYINKVPAVFAMQSAAIGTGLIVFMFFNMLPMFIGLIGLAIAVSFSVYAFYGDSLKASDALVGAVGFFLSYIIIISGQEISINSVILFASFFFVEIFIALIKKATSLEKYKDISANMYHVQAKESNVPEDLMKSILIKIMIASVFMGGFQIFSNNSYSIPVFSVIAIIWFLFSLKNWQEKNVSFKEVNKNIIKEVKSNIQDVKDVMKKDK